MRNKKVYVAVMMGCAMGALSTVQAARTYFNKSADMLVAQFDSKPDTDDIHAQAALGCMLAHSDFADVNYYAVAGAYGDQSDSYAYIDSTDLFNLAFGPLYTKWTDAHSNWDGSVYRVKIRTRSVLNAGGTVWVQEAGQSNFTADWIAALISEGMSEAVIKSRVIVVQHSNWNQNNTNPADLTYVKSKATYIKLDDGNTDPVASNTYWTPNFTSTTTSYLNDAKTSANAEAKALWIEADAVCDASSYNNPKLKVGGVDFSDAVEDWWIFSDEADVDDVASFWAKYVVNSDDNTGGDGLVQIRKRNALDYCINGGSGGADGQNVTLWTYIDGHKNLTWEEIDRGNGYYSYQKKGTTYSLDGGNGGANSQTVYLWTTSANNQNQQWKKVDMGGGFYQLQKRNALGFALNGGSGGANGQDVNLWSSDSTSRNLQWLIED